MSGTKRLSERVNDWATYQDDLVDDIRALEDELERVKAVAGHVLNDCDMCRDCVAESNPSLLDGWVTEVEVLRAISAGELPDAMRGIPAGRFRRGTEVPECKHEWQRRRDGRRCSKCDTVQFSGAFSSWRL